MPIPLSAFAAFTEDDFLLILGQLKQDPLVFSIANDSAQGYLDVYVCSVRTRTPVLASRGTVLRFEVFFEFEVVEGPKVFVGPDDHVPASSSVSSVGTAFGIVFFAVQMRGTFAAVAGCGPDLNIVNKVSFGHLSVLTAGL